LHCVFSDSDAVIHPVTKLLHGQIIAMFIVQGQKYFQL
jgi:hypothetical protein